MIGYTVIRNNERLCIAGVGDVGVLTACVTWTPTELNLQVGGLKSDEGGPNVHMRWIDEALHVGDEIKIQVIDTPRVDAAETEYTDDPVKDLEARKTYVRNLAKELGWELREP